MNILWFVSHLFVTYLVSIFSHLLYLPLYLCHHIICHYIRELSAYSSYSSYFTLACSGVFLIFHACVQWRIFHISRLRAVAYSSYFTLACSGVFLIFHACIIVNRKGRRACSGVFLIFHACEWRISRVSRLLFAITVLNRDWLAAKFHRWKIQFDVKLI